MMAELIDRKQVKSEVRSLLAGAQVSPKAMTALYLGLTLSLSTVGALGGEGLLGTFASILTMLMGLVLEAGFVLYCMAVRRGERAEFLTLFDGFSQVGRIIVLVLVMNLFVALWSMLFLIPGLIAVYRYRFALYNLLEDPAIGAMEAIRRSKVQTRGYKGQLFALDMSYLGWALLALLPTLAVFSGDVVQTAEMLMGGVGQIHAVAVTAVTSWLLSSMLCDLWSLAVSLFYLPNYQCADLAYFETAKRTSGVGFNTEPPRNDGWNDPWNNGPDGLGGL